MRPDRSKGILTVEVTRSHITTQRTR